MGGRPRKPTAIKKLQGTLNIYSVNFDEPTPEYSLQNVKTPSFLSRDQKQLWKYAISQAPDGVLTTIDIGLFTRWCVLYSKFISLSKALEEAGDVIYNDDGVPRANPLINDLNKLAITLRSIETELGFTPASRSKISVHKSEEEKNAFLEI